VHDVSATLATFVLGFESVCLAFDGTHMWAVKQNNNTVIEL
jgi:hypothetical protein